MGSDYQIFHRRSIEECDAFWSEQAALIHWQRPFEQVLDYSNPPFARWFVGGETNLCYNAVDRHLADRADQPALIYISSETGTERTYTFRELHVEVQQMAAVLESLGVGKGDRVLIYMPMIPEAIFAMLATVRLGAIHSVVFGGFAAHSLATRIDDARPKVMLIADAGIRAGKVVPYKALVDESVRLGAALPERVVMVKRGLNPAWLRKYDLSSLRHLFLAGEPLDEPTAEWIADALGKRIYDHGIEQIALVVKLQSIQPEGDRECQHKRIHRPASAGGGG